MYLLKFLASYDKFIESWAVRKRDSLLLRMLVLQIMSTEEEFLAIKYAAGRLR